MMSEGSGSSTAELGITQQDMGLDKSVSNNPDVRDQRLKIREFSKSTPEGRQARTDTARDILKQRAGDRQSRQQQKDFLTVSQTANEQNLANAEAKKVDAETQLLSLRAELTDRSTSWLAKVHAFVSRGFREETQELQKQLPKLEDKLEVGAWGLRNRQEIYQQELANLERQFAELSNWHQTYGPAGKDTLAGFYNKQGRLLKEHQSAIEIQRLKAEMEAYRQEHGTVEEITDKYPGYIVHGITPGFGGANNPILDDAASWQEKLAVIVTERPPLSASFVKKGNGPQFLWSPIGIVVQNGVVTEADSGDLASRVIDKKNKRGSNLMYIKSYQDGLERAVAKNNTFNHGYNEVILEFGSKAGSFFINLDQTGNTSFDNEGIRFLSGNVYRDPITGEIKKRLDRIEYKDIFESANFVGLPVVVMKDGILYESSYDQTTGLTVGRELSPQDITTLQTRVPSENLSEIQKRANSVLKTLAVT